MAHEKPNRLSEWILIVRAQVPVWRAHLVKWFEAVREEPRLIWETPAVRFSTYGLAAIIFFSIITSIPNWVASPMPEGASEPATTADFHVVCSNPDCGYHFVVDRELGFDDFPVLCPRCEQQTAHKARRCMSAKCRGRWVIPQQSQGDGLCCPVCGEPFE